MQKSKRLKDSYAFPCQADAGQWGMTIRDYFAAAALQGMLACPEESCEAVMISEEAYKYADAMLKARQYD